MNGLSVYAEPREVTDLGDCSFYHTTTLPGHGLVQGEWDLRAGIDRYLGGVDFRGKRVLDVGSASGFLSFHMESRGAEVVSYDLSEDHPWDFVPFAGADAPTLEADYRRGIRRLNNSYWLSHRAHRSRARKAHGTVYAIPRDIGPVHVAVFGSILLHLRDPFLALQQGLRLATETAIVTEMLPRSRFYQAFLGWLGRPTMTFLPEVAGHKHGSTWWELSPRVVRHFLSVLGFEKTRLSYHRQKFRGRTRLLFTVVGERTREAPRFGEGPLAPDALYAASR
jgi:hypothetical protein